MGNEYQRQVFEHTITLDLESIPLGDRDTSILKSIDELYGEAPQSYSKAKQEDWVIKKYDELEAAIEKEYRDRSFNPMKGRIICVGIKFDDMPVEMIKYEEDEKELLTKLALRLKEFDRYIYSSLFIGNSIYDFDIRFIIQKSFKFGLKDLMRYLPTNKYDKRIYDLSDNFNLGIYGKHTKLVDLCSFLDIDTPKGDLEGSMVLDAFMDGEIDRIETYCGHDVRASYECFLKMKL